MEAAQGFRELERDLYTFPQGRRRGGDVEEVVERAVRHVFGDEDGVTISIVANSEEVDDAWIWKD